MNPKNARLLAALGVTPSLESEELTATDVAVSEQAPIEAVEADLVEAAAEVEETSEVVEDLEASAASLEEIGLQIEEAVTPAEDGTVAEGLTEVEAATVATQIEGVKEDLGLVEAGTEVSTTDALGASLESFTGEGRLTASLEALERTKALLTQIWNAIKNAIVAAYQAVVNFFAKLFDGAARLSKRAEGVIKAAEGVKDAAGEVNVTVYGANKIAVAGVVDAGNTGSALTATKEVGDFIFGKYSAETAKFYKTLSDAAKDLAGGKDGNVEAALTGYTGAFNDIKNKAFGGGLVFQFTDVKGLEGAGATLAAKVARLTPPRLVAADEKGKLVSVVETKALSVAQAKDVAGKVKGIADALKAKKDTIKQLDMASTALRVELDKAAKEGDKGTAGKLVDRVRVRAVMSLAGKSWQKPVAAYASAAFATARVALNYAERSVAAHKKGAAA